MSFEPLVYDHSLYNMHRGKGLMILWGYNQYEVCDIKGLQLRVN